MPLLATRLGCCLLLALPLVLSASESRWIFRGEDGRLLYRPDAEGDRISDFAWCGYRDGRESLPGSAVIDGLPRMTVEADDDAADDAPRLQAAIDAVSGYDLRPDGWRGVVELAAGRFELDGQIRIEASGVILRGAGDGGDPAVDSILRHRQAEQVDTIVIAGVSDRQRREADAQLLVDPLVPAGARSFRVAGLAGLAVGDEVQVRWSGNDEWNRVLEMDADHLGDEAWHAGKIDLDFDRVISRLESIGDTHWVTVDAPLSNAIEARYSTVAPVVVPYDWPGRIEQVALLDLRGESTYAGPEDEEHPWHMVRVKHARDVWIEGVTARYYGRSLIRTGIRRLTVQECRYIDPISIITGNRRYAFSITGQQALVRDCLARDSRHDYVLEQWTCGPIAFVDCRSEGIWSDIGPHRQWGAGVLFDRIHARGRWRIADGLLHGSDVPETEDVAGKPRLLRPGAMPAGAPLHYRASVRVRALDEFARPALLARVHEVYERAFYYLELGIDSLDLKRFRFSNDADVYDSWLLPEGFDRSAWHELSLVQDGNDLVGFCDGSERVRWSSGEWNDKELVGVRIVDGDAQFDDLRVTDLAGEATYLHDDFAVDDALDAYWNDASRGLAAINVRNRGDIGSGHGWSGANNVIWNCDAETFIVQNPPTAQNWLIGSRGAVIEDTAPAGPQPAGYVDSHGAAVEPGSLYAAQYADRFAIAGAEHRQYWLGDVDALASADDPAVHADAAWSTAMAAATDATPRAFDSAAATDPVVATFRYGLAADERVAAASLALGIVAAADDAQLIVEATDRRYDLADFAIDHERDGLVLDLSPLLAQLQDGSCHLAVIGAAVDWAVLDLVVAPANTRSRTIQFDLRDAAGAGLEAVIHESPGGNDGETEGGTTSFDGLDASIDHQFSFDAIDEANG